MATVMFNTGGKCSEETIEKILLTKGIKKIIAQGNEKEVVYERRDERGKMNKAETIAYAIAKECRRMSLVNWCKEWGFTVEDFNRFLDSGKKYFEDAKDEQDD